MLFQFIANGLTAGALYALIAVGFALIFNGTRILHLAHGAVFTFAGYAMFILTVELRLNVILGLTLAVLLTGLVGAACEWLVYRPLRNRGAGPAAELVASIGLLTFLEAIFAMVFTTDTKSLHDGALATYTFGDVVLTSLHLVIAGVALVLFPVLQLFLTRTRYGRGIRALADNPRLAQVLGVRTAQMYTLIFTLGSALAGVASCLSSYDLGVRPQVGFSIMFIALVAVIVGGIGYLPGAAAGGMILGLLQQAGLWYLSARWQEVVVFGVLVVFLIVRPQGLFGGRMVVRRA